MNQILCRGIMNGLKVNGFWSGIQHTVRVLIGQGTESGRLSRLVVINLKFVTE